MLSDIIGPTYICLLNLMPYNQMVDPRSNRILRPLCCRKLKHLESSSSPLPAVYHIYGRHFVGTAHISNCRSQIKVSKLRSSYSPGQ